ncbi:protein kinase [Streptomyces sp. NPDC097619]|uniref:serine/threonine-protein kinase n=1 Tax=Streptomyces sp. NPDC097619 TaxID=3157228 RepID=UPI00332913CA
MGEFFGGRYELIDPIGRGGAGAVWRAWDHRRRRYVAAKVLRQSDAHTLLRFVREQALRIDHPHVLAPASWAADDDQVLFTMDLVRGGSLAHLIGDYGPLPPRFVCVLLDQLLSGLAAVHAEGVVHRDIKPANILLEDTGTGRPHLRLSDFGISMRKGEPRLTETHYVVGTPGYFAPEQLLGAEPDFAADLYAAGLVALYLLRGQKPDSQALVDLFLTQGRPAAPQGVPEPLWQVVATLLQPDPYARFRTATGARRALAEAVELLPPGQADEESVEVFDQLGPLPEGFGPEGPPPRGTHPPEPVPAGDRTVATTGPPTVFSPGEPTWTAPGGVSRETYAAAQLDTATARPRPGAAPVAVPSSVSGDASGAASSADVSRETDCSETGSFHLAPPAPGPQAPWPGASAPGPEGTRPYTYPRGVPGPDPSAPSPVAPAASPSAGVNGAAAKPGPPAKVAVPVLLVALLCFAVGFWALSQT